jgi:hypothetical protein
MDYEGAEAAMKHQSIVSNASQSLSRAQKKKNRKKAKKKELSTAFMDTNPVVVSPVDADGNSSSSCHRDESLPLYRIESRHQRVRFPMMTTTSPLSSHHQHIPSVPAVIPIIPTPAHQRDIVQSLLEQSKQHVCCRVLDCRRRVPP